MIRNSIEIADADGPRRLSWIEWGMRDNPDTVVCVHGLTRNARDFEALAAALGESFRIVCPDVAGRGRSDWLKDPRGYGLHTYVPDLVTLLDHLDVPEVDWVGTSMGGLIGMGIAGAEDGAMRSRIRRLVLNDVGPFIPKASLERIGTYVAVAWRFEDFDAVERHVRSAYASFGPLSDEQWRHLAENSVRRDVDGAYVPAYDPAIGTHFRTGEIKDVDLWPLWDRIACPVLILRGAESDLLLPETVAEMERRHDRAEAVTFPDVGHAPALMDDAQIAAVRDWLLRER